MYIVDFFYTELGYYPKLIFKKILNDEFNKQFDSLKSYPTLNPSLFRRSLASLFCK